jgi:hypothetical protein
LGSLVRRKVFPLAFDVTISEKLSCGLRVVIGA